MAKVVTEGYMVKFGTKLDLPRNFYEILTEDDATAVLIVFSNSTKMIRLLPIKADKIVKLSITIGHLSPTFMNTMTKLLADLGLSMLYNAGFCFTESSCLYEGYLKFTEESKIAIDDLIKKIEIIDSVESVETTRLSIDI